MTIPLKYVAHISAGQSPPSAEVTDLADGLAFLQGNAEFQAVHPAPRLECDSAPKQARKGDVLVSVRAPVGALNIADRRYGIGRGLCGIRAHQCDERFLWWWLHSQRPRLDAVSTGTTYKAVTAEDLGHLPFPSLSVDCQRRIADFLDAETARIDRLIHLQGLVMEKLDERERAQLDSALDELFNRWGAVPLRRFLRGVDQGTSPQADAFPAGPDEWGVLKVSCLRPGRFFPDANKRLPEDLEPDTNHEVRPGDLLITRANTPQLVGSTAVVPQVRSKLLLSDKIFRVRIDQRITTGFLATVARGTRIRNLCAASSNGASQSMANIRFEEVKAWPIPAAPLDAQRDLVQRVDRQRSIIDDLRTTVQQQVRLLAERRQALITAAVTGQFDISTASGRNVTEGVSE